MNAESVTNLEASASLAPTKVIDGTVKLKAPDGKGKMIFPQVSRLARASELVGALEPQTVASAVSAADGGDLGALQAIYIRMIATDARIKGHKRSLDAGLLANPLRVFPSKSKTPASKEYAEIANDMLYSMKTSDTIKRFAMPYLTGVRVYEPRYTVMNGRSGKTRVIPWDIAVVPPTLYKMDMTKDSKTYGELMVKTEAKPEGEVVSSFPWGRLIVGTDGEEQGWYDLGGSLRPCLFWYLVRTKNGQWWAELNETYGEPHRIVYFDEDNIDEQELSELENLVKNIGRAAYSLLPQGVDLELLESKLAGSIKTYQDLIEVADKEIAIAILGNTQTSDGGDSGSYAKANVHMSVQYQILSSIALGIKELFDDLIVSTIAFNVGSNFDPVDLPEIRLVIPNPEEKEVKARVFKFAQELGVQLPAQYVHDELGIPEADPDDVILVPMQKLAPQGADADPANRDKENVNKRDYSKEEVKRKSERP